MKKVKILVLVLLAFSVNLKAEYMQLGYQGTRNQTEDVDITNLRYKWYTATPNQITGFFLTIQNNTAYTITTIDVEITLMNYGNPFFKKLCRIGVSSCNPGEIQDTEEWEFPNEISRTNFGNNFTWSAKISQLWSGDLPIIPTVGWDARKKGAAFLAENKTNPIVNTTASGLQWIELSAGKGLTPRAWETVSIHYTVSLLDGKKINSSIDRGFPDEFRVNSVIKGLIEALQLMKVGSKWKLFIPTDLAYGDRGLPPDIGPGETLVFEVELLGIK